MDVTLEKDGRLSCGSLSGDGEVKVDGGWLRVGKPTGAVTGGMNVIPETDRKNMAAFVGMRA